MGIAQTDNLVGKLEIIDRPQNLSWSKPLEFVKALTRILRVRFPVNQNNDLIVKGWEVPAADDKSRMWAKFDQNTNFLGWHAFIKGAWRKAYTLPPGQISWFIGDSQNPPDGWEFIGPDSQVDAAIKARLLSLSVEDAPGSGRYILYAARFIGYSALETET